ncbi:MAG TPA: hypothetical protein VK497_04595 [Candidatus Saccharimonadales bacterium]|nr:hypothetical protein [Candidatus Saccharimonadales bacterium]
MAMYAFTLPERKMHLPRIIRLPATIRFVLLASKSDDDCIILETPSQQWQNTYMGGLERRGWQGRVIALYAVGAATKSSLGQLKDGQIKNGRHFQQEGSVFRQYPGLVNSHQNFPGNDRLVIHAPLWSGLRVVTSF